MRALALVIPLLVLAACAAMPAQELSDARQAISAATAAGAPEIAPELLAEARGRLEEAVRELGAGSYDRSRTAAIAARERAVSAREIADAVRGAREALGKDPTTAARDALARAEQAARRGDVAEVRRWTDEALRVNPRQ